MNGGLQRPAGAWVLAALYVALGAASFGDDRFLHDEGLLTHLFSLLIDRDFLPAFFLQKTRPPLALLYAPVAPLSLGAFLWVHLLVSAAAVPLVAATARRLGHAAPNVAAAVVALSPMYVAGGAAGLSNADAVAGVSLVLWLWVARRELLAGVLLGTLVWVRAELMVLVLVMLGWAGWHRRGRAVAGLLVWPVAYGLCGAVYHGYLPWMLHYPPALSEPMEGNPFWQPHHRVASLVDLIGSGLALSPAIVVASVCRPTTWRPLERWWVAFAVAFVGALVLLPRWQVFNFDQSPRYLMPVLPVLALVVGRTVMPWRAAGGQQVLALVCVAALGVFAHRTGGTLALSFTVLGLVLAALLARSGRPRAAVLAVLLGLALGPPYFGDGARIERRTQAAALDAMVVQIDAATGVRARPVVTNEPVLAAYLARTGGLPGVAVYYVVQADQVHEISALTNPANGQRERIFAALRLGLYGTPIFPDAMVPSRLPPDALLVLTDDPRLSIVMPPAVWDSALEIVFRGPRLTVAQHKREPRR